jgi:hypothetical protein
MTAVANLSKTEDPWLRIGKDGLFRAVMCSDYGPNSAKTPESLKGIFAAMVFGLQADVAAGLDSVAASSNPCAR